MSSIELLALDMGCNMQAKPHRGLPTDLQVTNTTSEKQTTLRVSEGISSTAITMAYLTLG